MKEISESFWSYLKEKTSTPLLTNLFVSFMLWNWKVVVILFFTDPSRHFEISKIQQIESVTNFCLSILFPILSGAAFTWAFPWVNNKVFEFLEKKEIERINTRVKLSSEKIITSDEYVKINTEYSKLRKEYDELLAVENTYKMDKKSAEEKAEAAETKLSKKEAYDSSYDFDVSLLKNSIANKSGLGISFNTDNELVCTSNQSGFQGNFYYSIRKLRHDSFLFLMVEQKVNIDSFPNSRYRIIEFQPDTNGQVLFVNEIGKHTPQL